MFLIKKQSKNISGNFSGAVAVSVGSVQFQIAPCSSLHFSISIKAPSSIVGVTYRDFNLLHWSLLKRFPLFIWLLFALFSACGSSFRVFHKTADSAAPAFCAFPARAAQAARSLTGALSPGAAGLLPSEAPASVSACASWVLAFCV